MFQGQIELDDSYFGGVRKEKRGKGAVGKVIVLVYSSTMVKSIRSLYLMLNRAS